MKRVTRIQIHHKKRARGVGFDGGLCAVVVWWEGEDVCGAAGLWWGVVRTRIARVLLGEVVCCATQSTHALSGEYRRG